MQTLLSEQVEEILANMQNPPSVCKLVVLGDLQIDYHDYKTLDVVYRFLADLEADVLVLNGDILDFTALSTFRSSLGERQSLLQQQGALKEILYNLRAVHSGKMVYVMGNHEHRLASYILQNAPELEGFVSFKEFAGLDQYDIELVEPWGAGYEWHGVLISHGELITSNSAKANMDKNGGSGITGHTHRLGAWYKTDRDGAHAWYEGGCLCDVHSTPPGKPGVRNWQQGFIVGYGQHDEHEEHVEKLWNIYPVSITNRRFIWNGTLYAPR